MQTMAVKAKNGNALVARGAKADCEEAIVMEKRAKSRAKSKRCDVRDQIRSNVICVSEVKAMWSEPQSKA